MLSFSFLSSHFYDFINHFVLHNCDTSLYYSVHGHFSNSLIETFLSESSVSSYSTAGANVSSCRTSVWTMMGKIISDGEKLYLTDFVFPMGNLHLVESKLHTNRNHFALVTCATTPIKQIDLEGNNTITWCVTLLQKETEKNISGTVAISNCVCKMERPIVR